MSREQSSAFEVGTDGPTVIVAGIDGSESSWRAAAYAGGLARRQKALLALVYVQPMGSAAAPGVGAATVQLGQEIARELEQEIRVAADRADSGVRWEFHTFPGDPYAGLVHAADELRADAVVIGASEKAGHRFAGSVAIRLVKSGRWPVTVVP